jgi:hypothetical protein
MNKKGTFTIFLSLLALLLSGAAYSGSLDSTAAPGATSSYTLEDVYKRLDTGTDGAQSAFTEPAAGPTAGTGHTVNEVMGKAPVLDNTNGAGLADVLSGKTFWGLTGGAWGPQIGTYTCPATATGTAVAADVLAAKTFSNSSSNGITGTMADNGAFGLSCGAANQSVTAGYYSGGTLTGDADLVAGNIRSGMNIFGVAGSSKVMDTSAGTAAAGDILSGKTAFVNGATVTGTVTAGSNVTGTAGSLSMTIPDGLYSGSKTATANDADLIAGNIKSGVNIFGVNGDSNVVNTSTGDAVAGEILSGKKAWVDGTEITGSLATQTVSNTTVSQPAGN